ncbi:MAG: peptidoglycan recognition family protein [Phycisphaerales bacterium]
MDTPSHSNSASRRDVLHLGTKAGALIAISGLVSNLMGGCGSASKRLGSSGNMVGQPIPTGQSPITRTPMPMPAQTVYSPQVAPRDMSQIPDFVIKRTQWTKLGTKVNMTDPMTRITRITVHHDAISPLPSGGYADSVRRLTSIRRGHLGNRWADIGYHYAIDPAGRAWQARPLIYQGAHVKDNNSGNIGIVVFGNYERSKPTSKALDTLNRLIAHEMRRFSVPLSGVYTHRELRSTACPGRNLQAQMNVLRSPRGALAMIDQQLKEHHA